MVSEGPGAVFEEPKVCEPIFKGPESVLKGLIPILETVQTRLVLKRPQRPLNRRTLDRYHRALTRLMVSEGSGPGFRVLYTALRLRALGLVSERPGIGPRGL